MEQLNEVKDILNQLSLMYEPAKSLLVDTVFMELLKEEVDAYRSERHQFPGRILFDINENGEVEYNGICEYMPKEFRGMTVVLNPNAPTNLVTDLIKQQSETIKKLEDKNTTVQERKVLIDKLDQFSKDIQKLGLDISSFVGQANFIEQLREQLTPPASGPSDMDKKKEALLNRLLAEK